MTTETDTEDAPRSFEEWLRRTGGAEVSAAVSPDAAMRKPRRGAGKRIDKTLLALRDDHRELPQELRGLLGPLQPRPHDAAERLLLGARHAPAGPRCRPYRAALHLAQRLEASDVEQIAVARQASA